MGTLRKAMQQLVDEGRLERRQGSGTFVRRTRLDKSLFRFVRHGRDACGAGIIPDSRILRREIIAADHWPQAARGLRAAGLLIRIDRLRLWQD